MSFFTSTALLTLIFSVLYWLLTKPYKERADANERHFYVRERPVLFFTCIGVILVILITLFIMLSLLEGEYTTAIIIIFSVFSCLPFFGIYVYFRKKVQIEEDTLTIYPLFSKKRSVSFSSITKVSEKTETVFRVFVVYSGSRKLFKADATYIGFGLLEQRLTQEGFL